jgi:hypothetical protein
MQNKIDGETKIHSAALAISGGNAEISHRVWSAEVGILFPFVEKKRHEILDQLNEVLQIPFKTRFGDVIEDLQDLEIGHIESQILTNNIGINPKLWNKIQILRQIRNALAHSEPVPIDLLCSEEANHW